VIQHTLSSFKFNFFKTNSSIWYESLFNFQSNGYIEIQTIILFFYYHILGRFCLPQLLVLLILLVPELPLLPYLLIPFINDLSPILLSPLHNPILTIKPGDSLHPKNLKSYVFVSLISIGHSKCHHAVLFDLLLMDGLEMLQHGVDR
jgi:hypothetical protein